MLDALALVQLEVFLDLAADVGALLVDRDADLAAGRRHRLGTDPAHLPLDVEVADLAEVEQALVEPRPFLHPTPVHVVGEVVDLEQARPLRLQLGAWEALEIDVVDGDVAEDRKSTRLNCSHVKTTY